MIDIPVLIHGMTVSSEAGTHRQSYARLWKGLLACEPSLAQRLADPIFVEWGHRPRAETSVDDLREDQRIIDAEATLQSRIAYSQLLLEPDARQDWFREPFFEWSQIWRGATNRIKDDVFCLGLTDALYYGAADGERAVRRAVYGQVLGELDPHAREEVRLHVIAHSLGATVAFDFLFGLFAPAHEPHFVTERQGEAEAVAAFSRWREKAQTGSLTLGSLATTGSQLALFLMRKQSLVDTLAHRTLLDPTVIGVAREGGADEIRWINFFDPDDLLGYPVRRLFDSRCIEEMAVNTGTDPAGAHSGYWESGEVLEAIAGLLAANAAAT